MPPRSMPRRCRSRRRPAAACALLWVLGSGSIAGGPPAHCAELAQGADSAYSLRGATAGESQLRRPPGVSIARPVAEQTSPEPAEDEAFDSDARHAAPASMADSLAVRLAPRGNASDPAAAGGSTASSMLGGPLTTIAGALAITLSLFGVFVILSRRAGGGTGTRSLPREAFEVIGQTTIGPRQKLLVVRCGVQAIVVGVSPAGIQPVAQIDDPDEAGQLIANCRGLGSASVFKHTLREIEREPAEPGFVDRPAASPPRGSFFLRA